MSNVITTFYYSDATTSVSSDTIISKTSYESHKTLLSATIGAGVISLDNNCFKGVTSLTSVILSSTITSFGNSCFENTSITSIIMPNTLTHIGTSCFSNCVLLETVSISDTLTFLDNSCFNTCTSLSTVEIPISVTILHSLCFYGCSSLESIELPANISSIDSGCFELCTSLRTIIFDNQNNLASVGTQVFKSLTQPINVTYYLTASGGLNQQSLDLQSQMPIGSTFVYNPNPSCFIEGTKILALNNELKDIWIPIECLKKGDIIKTYKHGYRKIDLIGKGYGINILDNKYWNTNMYKLQKSDTNGLFEDLIVTGGHALLVDNLGEYKEDNDKKFRGITPQIDDKYLLLAGVSKDFNILPDGFKFTYYHFTLENAKDDNKRFGVYANGILSETPSKIQFIQHNYILI